MNQQPYIKTEPGLNGQTGYAPMNNMMAANPNPQSARERAATLMQQRFGAAAANSVSQLQAQSQTQPPPLTMPGQPRPQNSQPQQQQRQYQVSNGQVSQIKQEPGYPPMSQPFLGNAQTDGAGHALSDWKAEVARRRESAQREPGQNDRVLREHLKHRMLDMEGGGLLVPLEERQQKPSPSSTRKLASDPAAPDAEPSLSTSIAQAPRAQAQFDGPGGDDEGAEDDEDAINSDLDDPEDHEADENEAEDAVGQVMLCTYDKVQRVKNKWKCTLKDGILTTGGKEYVFRKGQGEFEW